MVSRSGVEDVIVDCHAGDMVMVLGFKSSYRGVIRLVKWEGGDNFLGREKIMMICDAVFGGWRGRSASKAPLFREWWGGVITAFKCHGLFDFDLDI